jgi:hypothetical protein
MSRNQEKVSANGIVILILVMLNVIILKTAFINDAQIYWGLVITLPLLLIAIFDTIKKKLAIRSEIRKLKTPPVPRNKNNKSSLFGESSLWKLFGPEVSDSKNRVGDGFTVETKRSGRYVKETQE